MDGLSYESEIAAIYLGDFSHARMEPTGPHFMALLGGYIDSFSRQCKAQLPANKVEITKSECAEETVTRNGWGVEVNRYCSRYVDVGTGRYADPQLLGLHRQMDADMARSVFREAFDFSGRDRLQTMRQLADVTVAIGDDMTAMLATNGCGNAAVKRLQDNMLRFGRQQSPLLLSGNPTLADLRSTPGTAGGTAAGVAGGGAASGGAFRDSNYQRLLDDLVQENARGWMMNRYVAGSLSQVSVTSRDSAGRPSRVRASYLFDGFGGRATGTVMLAFKDGLPDCLYFNDAPNACRLANRRIVTSYEKGEYQ